MDEVPTSKVKVGTKWFDFELIGANALAILLFLMMMANIGIGIWDSSRRQAEYAQVACMIKLNIYLSQQPQDVAINWMRMPIDIYPCVPKFLFDERPRR